MYLSLAAARAYQHSFEHHPNYTLAVTGGTLNAIGDIVAQSVQLYSSKDAREAKYDVPRTFRFFMYGVGISPFLGRWNQFLETRFPLRSFGGKVSFPALSKRVAADQLIMAPVGIVLFIGSMGIMEGRDPHHIRQKYTDMFSPALVTNWKVWPLIQMVNFRFMPLPYRIPFQMTCGVFWTLYLSMLNARENKIQEKQDQKESQSQPLNSRAVTARASI